MLLFAAPGNGDFFYTNMMKMKRILAITVLLVSTWSTVFAQYIISGYVADRENKNPVALAHILATKSTEGTVTNDNGSFRLMLKKSKGMLTVSALGYEQQTISYDAEALSFPDTIFLKQIPYELSETVISAGLSKYEINPIAVSEISADKLRQSLGDQPLPLVLSSIPGVYSVRDGGGSGDAELYIRGFNQENVSVMLNGIPINGVENGLVYWSNWLNLEDAVAKIQVQKGPGAANLGNSAVGGSINILTNTSQPTAGGTLGFQVTDYGNWKTSLSLNSGRLNNGWSISFMASYNRGPGYVDATYVSGGAYFLSLNKNINKRNKISVTLLGAPQKHGQRTLKLTNSEHSLHGNKFNKDWGSYNGQINNASENFYHKPFLSVNHYLELGKAGKLTNILYISAGNGGGKWSESFNYAPTIFEYRNYSGQIDWPAIYENNATHEETYTLENGETVSGYSLNVQTHFLASHFETGYSSTYEQKFNDHFDITAGIHYRYFRSFLREQITDLLGCNFYIDDYAWAVDGVAGRNQIKTVGDIIKVNNHTIINYLNAYVQLNYTQDKVNAYLSFNGNNNWYARTDDYNYAGNTRSETVTHPGFDTRAGISYKTGLMHSLYVNGAFISRAPYFKFVFGNFTNEPVINLKNEQIETVELGYRFNHPNWKVNLGAYYTSWKNVSILSNEYVQLEDNRQTRAMINGLNSLHKGAEMEVSYRLSGKFTAGGFVSIGDYRWKNDVTAKLLNDDNAVVDTVHVFAKDIFVGGSAQQQYGLYVSIRILKFFKLKTEVLYYNKIYAAFDPVTRNDPSDRSQPYEIPGYTTLNIYFAVPFNLFGSHADFRINGYNICNNIHIVNGEDGTGHNLETFKGFWSFGRHFDFSLQINF